MNTTQTKIKKRCAWVTNDPLYIKYHDEEWGIPNRDDLKMFEFLILESAQAGLSWIIILRKRENYRKSFLNFDPKKIAQFKKKDIARLLKNPGIIRNKKKIEAAVNNAKIFLKIKKEFGSFSKYIWNFIKNKPIHHKIKQLSDYPKFTKEAETISLDLKKRGFKFMGPSIVYAHMQALGMVNDHMAGCFKKINLKL